ncbi:serine/threonine-protein kinase [Gemmata sp.]|uniref:serine/threonine-protein kinase n=1 Tax=Gemmata sp. TaxID=1914242 RepID=UPI003F722717
MRAFLTCLAEAVAEKGLRGLAELVPGGPYLAGVAEATFQKYRARVRDAQHRAEIQALAQATFDEVRAAAAAAARAAVPDAPPAAALELELYLTQVPGAVRRSLVRPDDTTGRTAPADYALGGPGDVLRLLPEHPPRFRPGDGVPGLDGWTLVRPLGSGGFGEVWLARGGPGGAAPGAVKFCHPERAAELRHEADVIRRVRDAGPHPHIVQLLHSNLGCDAPWLLYEYVAGGVDQADLGGWVRALQTVPPAERARQALIALRQLCPAVAHFHALAPAVVHRDLKPANILVDARTRKLKITDFGIGAVTARAAAPGGSFADAASTGRRTAFLRGAHSPLYSSAQQRAGSPPDPRDDVHALGVIAYQLLTGQLTSGPGTDFAHDLRAVGVDRDLIALIGACVSNNPARRPADAGAMLDRLPGFAGGPVAEDENRAPLVPVLESESARVIDYRPGDEPEPADDPRAPARDEPEPADEPLFRPRRRAARDRTRVWWVAGAGAFVFLFVPFVGVLKKLGRAGGAAATPPPGEPGPAAADGPDPATPADVAYERGVAYLTGTGVPYAYTKARAWLEHAAERGHAAAQANLGLIYHKGLGVRADQARAAQWFQKSAAQGHVDGQCNLGVMYVKGLGVDQDFGRAKEWFSRAAAQLHPPAQAYLGLMCANGQGGPVDHDGARDWYKLAAARGEPLGEYGLGCLYESGHGVTRSVPTALAWYRKAAARGDDDAKRAVARLEPR